MITGCSREHCTQQENLSRCSRCLVVQYCSPAHQKEDWSSHKSICAKLKKAQDVVDKEEAELRAHPGDMWMSANPFEDHEGMFWSISETRPYMRARYGVVDIQMTMDTQLAISAALSNIMDMLRLCRGDNMGVRDIAPGLFLRLHRDQECYDFVKWWARVYSGEESKTYDWGDMSQPYLSIHNADVFEDVNLFDCGEYSEISTLLPIMLIKIRLLLDLRMLHATPLYQRSNMRLGTDVIRNNATLLATQDRTPQIAEVEKQIQQLYDAGCKANKQTWLAVMNPEPIVKRPRPMMITPGGVDDLHLNLLYNYKAWGETRGATEVLEEFVRRNAGRK
ncbi:hypothetical protein DM02DRAFT_594753 [Periconia macrospinosa]|uniref:MYND-type domain-containing protein n=1 Tax=Periconia macrospinosa TaxID=97972 RepID=A0A2V1DMX4_9PLEO|nr:hypothetical protein DM02DRAFT_594753 [Periconia macrospinosa]